MTLLLRSLKTVVSAIGISLLMLSPALPAYRIAPGDVLSLVVNGAADLNTRAPVDDDGQVVLPLIGSIRVGGLTLAEATATVQSTLPTKEIDQRLQDGRVVPIILSPFQINLTIAEYRPVYVSGDVSKPGAVSYRPGLTARQAVALAGGLDSVRSRGENPFMQISQLKGQANESLIDYLKQQALVIRLQAEALGQKDFAAGSLDNIPLSRALIGQVLANEQSELVARNNDWAKQKDYLTRAVKQQEERSDLLDQERRKETAALDNDSADLQRYEDLLKKGAVAMPSVSEARRNVLISATRALQTASALALSKSETSELEQRLSRLDDQRRTTLSKELQDATLGAATAKAKLLAVNTQLGFAGAANGQVAPGFGSGVTINIERDAKGQPGHVVAEADTQLQPGDVVEISIPSSASPFPAP